MERENKTDMTNKKLNKFFKKEASKWGLILFIIKSFKSETIYNK